MTRLVGMGVGELSLFGGKGHFNVLFIPLNACILGFHWSCDLILPKAKLKSNLKIPAQVKCQRLVKKS